ncbi:YitT family protein [Hujiaoplasma nucleasis]|uniref:YitT family protein n=1 Tax=Hujiaoplasma nucleasis TaxID=2725268 RepID=A0A7L6N5W1_9MOLU|nr:YitT family protein [Hujiaoplasma nucleasis]QLY40638.1 YitT family protein [Hujiaoplasma nucleasis]
MSNKVKEYIYINIGVVMVALGMYVFLMPSNLATGGANGLAIVLNYFIPILPVGVIMVFINIILFVIAFIVIGKGFGFKTIYASLAVSLLVYVFEKVFPMETSLTGDILLELIFGIVITGVGMGIVFNQNASTGGTDISAKILHKFFHINLGKAVFLSDIVITVFSAFAFGINIAMYAMLGVLLNSFVIDYIIDGLNLRKEVTIVSDHFDEIKTYIIETLDRSFTIYYGKGGYSNLDKKLITTVISKREFIRLRTFINELDSNAFVTVKNTHEVYGDGFSEL